MPRHGGASEGGRTHMQRVTRSPFYSKGGHLEEFDRRPSAMRPTPAEDAEKFYARRRDAQDAALVTPREWTAEEKAEWYALREAVKRGEATKDDMQALKHRLDAGEGQVTLPDLAV